MQLSDQLITSFQELYKEHFGVEISQEQATEEGSQLIRFVKTINNLNEMNQHEKIYHK